MNKELLQQALDALKGADQIDVDMQNSIEAIEAAIAQSKQPDRDLQHAHIINQFKQICKGKNCNASLVNWTHSPECVAEHDAAIGFAQPEQRPEFILSAMGDLVFDVDDGYEELLESLAQPEQPERKLHEASRDAAVDTLLSLGYTYYGAASWKPPIAQPEQERDAFDAGFIQKTNIEYAAWCSTYYQADALDERGMASLHGLWAWQEQERRAAIASQKGAA